MKMLGPIGPRASRERVNTLSPAGMSLTKLSLAGGARGPPGRGLIESLVIDIPAEDGKIINLFLQCKMNLKSKEDVLLPLSKMARATSIMLERRRPVS